MWYNVFNIGDVAMRKMHKLNVNPKMESKDQFNNHFDKTFDAIYDAIDIPALSLFQIVEQIKNFKFVVTIQYNCFSANPS